MQVPPQRLTTLDSLSEKCLHAIELLHLTSLSYIHVRNLRGNTLVLEKILSRVLDLPEYGAVGSPERIHRRSFLKAVVKDIEGLFTQTQEVRSVADRLHSRLDSYRHDECNLYLRTISVVFAVAYTDHECLRAVTGSSEQRRMLETILCATGLVIFEGLIFLEKINDKRVKLQEPEKGKIIAQSIEECLGTWPQEAVPAFYHQLKRLAQDEAAAERLHNTLFDGLILI